MSEVKDMLVEVIEKIFKDNIEKETVDILEDGQWAQNIWALLVDNEMINIAVAEQAGGAGGDIEDLFSIYQLIGKYAAPIPFIEHTLANLAVNTVGGVHQEALSTIHFQEGALTLQGNSVTGTLTFVPWGRYAKTVVTLAHDTENTYLVTLETTQAKHTQSTNLAAEPRDTLQFDATPVVDQHVLTDDELHTLVKLMTAASIAKMAGAIEMAYQLTIRFSKEREQFGKPIHRFQLVQQHLAMIAGEHVLIDTALDNILQVLVNGTEEQEIAYGCLRIDEASRVVATIAHQVHAALGVTHEHSLHQFTRRLWSWRDENYTARFWQNQLAQQALTSNSNTWATLTKTTSVTETIPS